MKRKISIITAALGLVIISACSSGNTAPRAHQSNPSSPPPSVFGPPNAVLGRTGLISKLPDTCQGVKPSLPAGMSKAFLDNSFTAPVPNFQECVWSELGNTSARVFRYGFWQYDSREEAHKSLIDEARAAAFDDENCRYTGAVKNLFGLGEEAFSAPCTYKKYNSTSPESEHVYELGGANVVFRTRNVLIRLWWVEANYPTSETKQNPHWLHGGKNLSYEQALPQAIPVAKAVLTHFPE